WAPDSKALYVLERMAQIRRWTLPGFTEQAVIPAGQGDYWLTLAVSPDSRTLAVAGTGAPGPRSRIRIRQFDLDKGVERRSLFPLQGGNYALRLVFSGDGKSIGTCEMAQTDKLYYAAQLSWWDVMTGKSASPSPVRLAVQPAGLGAYGPPGRHL